TSALFCVFARLHLATPSFPTRRSSDLLVGPGHRLRLRTRRRLLPQRLGGRLEQDRQGTHLQDPRSGTGERSRRRAGQEAAGGGEIEEHTSELQSPDHLVCRLLLEKKKN